MVKKFFTQYRKVLFILSAIFIFAAIGTTIALNNDLIVFNNSFELSKHIATSVEEFTPPDDWQPCEEIPKTLVTKNNSNHNISVRLSYSEYWRDKDDTHNLPLTKDDVRLAVIYFQNEDDWELHDDGWYYFKEQLKPGESTTSLFRAVKLDCSASFGGDNICRETETGTVCEKPHDNYEGAVYHLKITVQTSDDNEFPKPEYCNITVNPNGGIFRGSSDIYQEQLRCGEDFDLSDISYTDHELSSWAKGENDTISPEATNIAIEADTELTANWLSSIWYNVTVDPNGGTYDGSDSPSTYAVRNGDTFILNEASYSDDAYFLEYWQVIDGNRLEGTSFIVTSDMTIQANWNRIVARIERTGKLYSSIMNAETEAQNGDTITLLVDTEETVTNEKTVTLDLNGHTITGSLTNTSAGDITLINGEINNPDGTAVTNNGALTMGINDYSEDDGSAHIVNDNIRIIGANIALKQNGTFSFYDGYLEADIGLDGGYQNAPFYRRMSDDAIIYYYPAVQHLESSGHVYQHVELESTNRAVSRTIDNGVIYYYNLQDNINTSARTGYKIYAVRDFGASYPITIDEGDVIDFDIYGYNVTWSDDVINNGTFNISDSRPQENIGAISLNQTITNNGSMDITNTIINQQTANTLLINNKDLVMQNSTLSSESGIVLKVQKNGSTITMDNDSYLTSDSTNQYVVHNSATDLVLTGGNIHGNNYRALLNAAASSIAINGATITSVKNETIYNENNATVTINSGSIKNLGANNAIRNNSGSAKVYLNGGEVIIDHSADSNNSGFNVIYNGTITVNGGKVIAKQNYHTSITGISSANVILESGSIEASIDNQNTSTNGTAKGLSGCTLVQSGGAISVSNTSGTAIGADLTETQSKNLISGGTITVSGSTTNSNNTSYGVDSYTSSSTYTYGVTITGGTITASLNNGRAIGVRGEKNTITGGKIIGGTYGLYSTESTTVGDNSNGIDIENPEIIGGEYGIYGKAVSFYDGVLRGDINAFAESVITAIPDATDYHIERNNSTESCWLVPFINYLEVDDVEYNSLMLAYDAVENGGTIKVIRNASTAALLPTNPAGKEITIDLNGHQIEYTQSLINEGALNIIDSSQAQTGRITNPINDTVINNGTMTVNSGNIVNESSSTSNSAINLNKQAASLTINGGKISGSNYAIHMNSKGVTNITMTGGIIESQKIGIHQTSSYANSISLTGGTVQAIGDKTTTIAIDVSSSTTVTIDGATIYSEITNNAGGVTGVNGKVVLLSGSITAKSTLSTSAAYGIAGSLTQSGGTVTVSSINGAAYGVSSESSSSDISGGTITATSGSKDAYGIKHGSNSSAYLKYGSIISGGTITAVTNSPNNVAVGVIGSKNTITGGKISGSSYGLTSYRTSILGTNDETIDKDAPEIYGGIYALYNINASNSNPNTSIEFYDGILKGGTSAYEAGVITAIPDNATYHREIIDGIENCWLVADSNYLLVNGVEYNSLVKAFAAANSGDTVKVIGDTSTEAILPTNPAGKTITFDLNGHFVNYTQPLINEGILNIVDNSANHDGAITNSNTHTIQNHGILNISSGTINNTSNKTSIYSIYFDQGTANQINISGGIITSTNSTIGASAGTTNTLTLTGGQINCVNACYTGNTKTRNTVQLLGGSINAVNQATQGAATAISSATITINGADITARSNSTANGIHGSDVTLINGSIQAYSTNGAAYGVSSSLLNQSGGSIYANGASARGVDNDSNNVIVSNGTITAIATASTNADSAIGIASGGSSSSYYNYGLTMSGGTITATSSNGGAYGLRGGTNIITGGSITGDTYGIYTYRKTTIGTNDGTPDSSPTIIGSAYALYDGSVYYYDGILKGAIKAYLPIVVKEIADNSTIKIENETIDGVLYEVRSLVAEHDVAKIGSTNYPSLYDAVTAASNGDTIELLENNYVFNAITIPSEKDIIIDTAGYNIFTGTQFVINGKLKITNSSTNSSPIIKYYESDYFFSNNGTLELDKLKLDSKKVIDNKANAQLIVNSSEITAVERIIDNKGAYSVNNSVFYSFNPTRNSSTIAVNSYNATGNSNITGSTVRAEHDSSGTTFHTSLDRAINQTSASKLEINNSSIYGYIDNSNGGEINIVNGSAIRRSQDDRGVSYSLINNGTGSTVLIDNSAISINRNNTDNGASSTDSLIIKNSGTLTLQNGAAISAINIDSYSGLRSGDLTLIDNSSTGIANISNADLTARFTPTTSGSVKIIGINNAGTLNYVNSNITIDYNNAYGIRNASSNATILSGNISLTGNVVYGLYIDGGEVTLGEAEATNSPNYGKSTANVSVTSPLFQAIGTTTGISIKNNSAKYNYYDGKLVGSTDTNPEIPTKVEYLYEPIRYLDANTGNYYTILVFMQNNA